MLSRKFLTVGEVEGPPLTEYEPERLVEKCQRGSDRFVWLGVNTTHEMFGRRGKKILPGQNRRGE